jgi:hypothetical protein
MGPCCGIQVNLHGCVRLLGPFHRLLVARTLLLQLADLSQQDGPQCPHTIIVIKKHYSSSLFLIIIPHHYSSSSSSSSIIHYHHHHHHHHHPHLFIIIIIILYHHHCYGRDVGQSSVLSNCRRWV